MTSKKIQAQLDQCTGTERYHSLKPFTSLVITDGVKLMADLCKAYWLVTDVAVVASSLKDQEFILVKLQKDGNKATVEYEDGNNNLLTVQHYKYTDFPLNNIRLYVENNVILLPSER